MTVAELIEHLKTLPQDVPVGYANPCFGGMEMEADKGDIYFDPQTNYSPRIPYVRIGDYGECHLD